MPSPSRWRCSSAAGLIGIHTNMPATVPAEIQAALTTGGRAARRTSRPTSSAPATSSTSSTSTGSATRRRWRNRPQTLYAIADSPVGLAAWMLDHDARSYELIARVFDGEPEGLTRDDILDNVTLYWLTNTAVSSARLYWESKLAFFAPEGRRPSRLAVSVFPDEIYAAPRSWAEQAYPEPHPLQPARPRAATSRPGSSPSCSRQELRAAFRSLR